MVPSSLSASSKTGSPLRKILLEREGVLVGLALLWSRPDVLAVVRTPDADYVPVLTLYLLCSFHTVPRYQLIQFILQVKGTQFLSGGLINSFVMAASYWRCVNWAGGLASGAAHDCDTSGSYLCHTISMLYAHLISFSFVPPHLRSQRYGSLCRSMTNISVPISCCWYCFPSFRPRESVLLLLGNGLGLSCRCC